MTKVEAKIAPKCFFSHRVDFFPKRSRFRNEMHLRPQFQKKARQRETDVNVRAERLKILLDVTPGKQRERLAAKKYFIKENIWVANFESDR